MKSMIIALSLMSVMAHAKMELQGCFLIPAKQSAPAAIGGFDFRNPTQRIFLSWNMNAAKPVAESSTVMSAMIKSGHDKLELNAAYMIVPRGQDSYFANFTLTPSTLTVDWVPMPYQAPTQSITFKRIDCSVSNR